MTYPFFGRILGPFRPPRAQIFFKLFRDLQDMPKHNLHDKFHDCICSLRVVLTVKRAQKSRFLLFFEVFLGAFANGPCYGSRTITVEFHKVLRMFWPPNKLLLQNFFFCTLKNGRRASCSSGGLKKKNPTNDHCHVPSLPLFVMPPYGKVDFSSWFFYNSDCEFKFL